MLQPDDVLNFWFQEIKPEQWFKKDVAFDQLLYDRFYRLYQRAIQGKLSDWTETPKGCLALILLLDQFSRNFFRDQEDAFTQDAKAIRLAEIALNKEYDSELPDDEMRKFLYMPFMHAENLADQEKGVELFKQLHDLHSLDYMIRHRDIIARFGRFPHRNQALGRQSTPEEIEFLKEPNSSF